MSAPAVFDWISGVAVPALLGGGALVVAIASWRVAAASHQLATALALRDEADRTDQRRVSIAESVNEWFLIVDGAAKEEDESAELAASVMWGVVTDLLRRSEIQHALELFLIIDGIRTELAIERWPVEAGRRATLSVSESLVVAFWRANPALLYEQKAVLLVTLEGNVPRADMTPEMVLAIKTLENLGST